MNLKTLFMGICLTGLSACAATTGPQLRSGDGQTMSKEAKLYGEYLAASYASSIGDNEARSHYYSRAFAHDPDNYLLGHRALISALVSGDNALARTLAIEIISIKEDDGFSRAILGAHELAGGHYQKSLKYLRAASSEKGVESIISLMRGWAHIGLNDQVSAIASFESLDASPYYKVLGQLQLAQVYGRAGDKEKAQEYFAKVDAVGISSIETLLSETQMLASNGDIAGAKKKLNTYAKENNGPLSGPMLALMKNIDAGDIGKIPSAEQMASRALSEPAFEFYARQRRYQTAQSFLRLALELDPDNHKALLFLGTVLESEDNKNEAKSVYDQVPDTSPFIETARLSSVNILMEKDENEAAIKALESIHASTPSTVTISSLGRAHLIVEDYESALPYYNALIKQTSAEDLKRNPNARYLRGICLERLGRWEEAVADFEFVLEQKPDNADALNYLGYTWVDKGVHLTKAMDMIRRAVKLEPESGAIIDSLGWAYYKLGRYSDARIQLEEAAERSPSSATIIDHLGDVYWKLGRRREAGYQWERALSTDPTDEERAKIKAKLKGGLSAAANIK